MDGGGIGMAHVTVADNSNDHETTSSTLILGCVLVNFVDDVGVEDLLRVYSNAFCAVLISTHGLKILEITLVSRVMELCDRIIV